jgi:hypothetical protein
MMTNGSDEKTGAPALDDVPTAQEIEVVVREAADGAAAVPSPSNDSPKPHGDKMEHAVHEAARAPSKGNG